MVSFYGKRTLAHNKYRIDKMKKLIYVFTSASIQPSSVQKKVLNQIRILNISGCVCKGLFFTTENVENISLPEADFIQVEKIQGGWYRSSRQRTAYHKAVYKYFTENAAEFDLVYYRYPGAHRYLLLLMEKLGAKVFFEHLTNETQEIKLYRLENKFRLNLSSVLSYFEYYYLPLFREYYYGSRIRKKAGFGICNSEEIANVQRKITGNTYKIFIIGDSADTDAYPEHKSPVLNDSLQMVFLKGAKTAAIYNGIDRIYKGIANYSGEYKLELHILGNDLSYENSLLLKFPLITNNIVFHTFISGKELDKLFESFHIGVSQFGMHRKGIISNTTIKSREYFARGIPFIFGHHDPDISDNAEAKPFFMEFPADEGTVDFALVVEWYKALEKIPTYNTAMKNFAKKNLDYKVKMEKLVLYLEGNF